MNEIIRKNDIDKYFAPALWNTLTVMAQAFYQSKALPEGIDNPAKVLMVLQAGREIGLKPIESLQSFYFVNGKLTLYGQRQIAQVIKAGYRVDWGECSNETAEVTISRDDRGKYTAIFTAEEAEKRGLTKTKYGTKEVWAKHKKNMLMYKAFGEAARFFCPEALDGYYSFEEMIAESDESRTKDIDAIEIFCNRCTKNGKFTAISDVQAQKTKKEHSYELCLGCENLAQKFKLNNGEKTEKNKEEEAGSDLSAHPLASQTQASVHADDGEVTEQEVLSSVDESIKSEYTKKLDKILSEKLNSKTVYGLNTLKIKISKEEFDGKKEILEKIDDNLSMIKLS